METLESYLAYLVAELIETPTQADLVQWAIEAERDGLLSIPDQIDIGQAARQAIEKRLA